MVAGLRNQILFSFKDFLNPRNHPNLFFSECFAQSNEFDCSSKLIASYYVLFAVMGASGRTLVIEIIAASGFLLFAVLGFRRSLWLVVAAIVGHGVFDFVHHLFIENPGIPRWWPGFCLAFDVSFGGSLACT